MLKWIPRSLIASCILALAACQAPGPKYKNVGSYNEGLAPVQMSNGRWGYIDKNQRLVIPVKYEDAREFREGKAAVRMNGKWGFIDRQGQWQ